MKIFTLIALMVMSQVSLAQAESKYVNLICLTGLNDSKDESIDKQVELTLDAGGKIYSGSLEYKTPSNEIVSVTIQWLKSSKTPISDLSVYLPNEKTMIGTRSTNGYMSVSTLKDTEHDTIIFRALCTIEPK